MSMLKAKGRDALTTFQAQDLRECRYLRTSSPIAIMPQTLHTASSSTALTLCGYTSLARMSLSILVLTGQHSSPRSVGKCSVSVRARRLKSSSRIGRTN